jgi:NAD(P)-dependent dehydrogenase (short-subunit alcohol dehydrogenase family)
MRIDGTRAWITGGSSGNGAALARELAARGAHVAVTARRAELLEQVAASAEGPGDVHAYPGDVRDRDGLVELAERIRQDLGPIDLAVLGAGTWQQVNVAHWDSTPIRDHIETNLLGMVNSLDAILPAMIDRGAGRIVGIASVAGYRGYTRAEAYGTTKAAEINLLESLRIDLAPLGLGVQTVNPGFVRTPLTRRNRFPMPFMIEAPDAARRIARAIERDKAEAVFPLPYLVGMKLIRWAPVRPYTGVSAWLAGR